MTSAVSPTTTRRSGVTMSSCISVPRDDLGLNRGVGQRRLGARGVRDVERRGERAAAIAAAVAIAARREAAAERHACGDRDHCGEEGATDDHASFFAFSYTSSMPPTM
jgi:hypothetical protein